jgi:hypothetical protein
MKTPNTIEQEINRIRLEIYEETKNLTPEERTRRSNELGRKLAAQYGFTIGTPTSRVQSTVVENVNH